MEFMKRNGYLVSCLNLISFAFGILNRVSKSHKYWCCFYCIALSSISSTSSSLFIVSFSLLLRNIPVRVSSCSMIDVPPVSDMASEMLSRSLLLAGEATFLPLFGANNPELDPGLFAVPLARRFEEAGAFRFPPEALGSKAGACLTLAGVTCLRGCCKGIMLSNLVDFFFTTKCCCPDGSFTSCCSNT